MQDEKPSGVSAEPAVAAELRKVTAQARAGDASALPRLRRLLDGHPEIWERAGDLERVVVRAWAELLAVGDPVALEAVRRKAEQLRAELEGDAPTPLERLLVGQVVAARLAMGHAQAQEAGREERSLGQARFALGRSESALRRYLSAVRTLATVRALVPHGLMPVHHLRPYDPDRKQLA
jgi:hypothetical protein